MASDWWQNTAPAYNSPGGATYGGGGYAQGINPSQYRDRLDMARSMAQDVNYPDGYLGVLDADRQQDKLTGYLQKRLQERSYQRGVHVGSRIGRDQYFWPVGFDPMERIAAEAKAVRVGNVLMVERNAPTLEVVERLAHGGKGMITQPEAQQLAGQAGYRAPGQPVPSNMLPRWR